METVTYNYFCEIYGFINTNDNDNFESKYESTLAKDIKKVLTVLKSKNVSLLEINLSLK